MGTTRAHLKESLHQEPGVKSEDLSFGEMPIFGNVSYNLVVKHVIH